MRRYVSGLSQANGSSDEVLPDGLFLARVARLQYHWHAQKPYYVVLFTVLEPKPLAGNRFSGRLYCAAKALWKLNWFLRDFGYDPELIGRDEIDGQQLVGLSGMIKITHTVVKGNSVHNLDGFAPASQWEKVSAGMDATLGRSKVSRDL